MLLHSFYDYSYLKRQKISVVTTLIKKAHDKKQSDLLWQRWLMLYPYMERQIMTFVSFQEYKETLYKQPQKTTNISDEEILAEMNDVVAAYRKGR